MGNLIKKMSGYSATVTASGEPELQFLTNIFHPGCGTMLAAYYGKNNCCAVWGVGFGQAFLYELFQQCAWIYFGWTVIGWFLFLGLAIVVHVWAIFHSYLIWRASKET